MRKERPVRRFFDDEDLKSPISEAFRALRANLQFTRIDKDNKIILLSSTKPEEGKTTVTFNLAASLALANKSVLLIDSDLRKPRVHKFLGTKNYIGLTNILVEDLNYIEVINLVDGYEGFHVITAGPIPPNPSELLSSAKMKSFLAHIEKYYDYIIIDSPPVGSVADAVVLSTLSHGVILVARSGHIKRDELIRTKDSFEKVGANLLGVVLNDVTKEELPYDYYYNYYAE